MKLSDIKKIGNLGAGTMGHATALQFAIAGYPVSLLDNTDEALERGVKFIKNDLDTFAEAGLLSEDPSVVLSRISTTTSYEEGLEGVDFVIESVFENLAVKQQVWEHVEACVMPETVLATNTSGLSPTAIARVLTHPERFCVAHFWNPAHLMPLVEVVPGEKTSKQTIDVTVELMNHIGKHAVGLGKESLGFVGNRIQLAVIREATHIIEEGIANATAIDDIVKYSLGRRWALVGPIASADLGGLDVFGHISEYLYADLARETEPDPLLKQKMSEGKLGAKTGEGFYTWSGEAGQALIAYRDRELLANLKRDQDSA